MLASAGVEGEGATSSPLMPEENRNMTVNSCCARGSRIASSLWRTWRTARSWRVDALVNREVLSALTTVWLPLGPYEIYLFHCS